MAGTKPGPDPMYADPRTHTLRTDGWHFDVYKAEATKAGLSLNAYLVKTLARVHGLRDKPDQDPQRTLYAVDRVREGNVA